MTTNSPDSVVDIARVFFPHNFCHAIPSSHPTGAAGELRNREHGSPRPRGGGDQSGVVLRGRQLRHLSGLRDLSLDYTITIKPSASADGTPASQVPADDPAALADALIASFPPPEQLAVRIRAVIVEETRSSLMLNSADGQTKTTLTFETVYIDQTPSSKILSRNCLVSSKT